MTTTLNGFHVRFEAGADKDAAPLLLLHGTGGDEHQLIDLGRMIAPERAMLGVRGRVTEGLANRWFRRLAEGVFDMADLEARATELAAMLRAASATYGFASAPIAVGYSNGANIASALMMRAPDVVGGAVLMRAMNTLSPADGLSLTGRRVLFLSGAHDPMAPAQSRAMLAAGMKAAGADVSETVTSSGHQLTQQDVASARDWLSASRPLAA